MPLTVGQRVVLKDGRLATVTAVGGSSKDGICNYLIHGEEGHRVWWTTLGRRNKDKGISHDTDAVADAPPLTLPLTPGQRVVCWNGEKGIAMTDEDGDYCIGTAGHRWWVDRDTGAEGEVAECRWDAIADDVSEPEPASFLPLKEGQKVVDRKGRIGTVQKHTSATHSGQPCVEVRWPRDTKTGKGSIEFWHLVDTGQFCLDEYKEPYERDIVA